MSTGKTAALAFEGTADAAITVEDEDAGVYRLGPDGHQFAPLAMLVAPFPDVQRNPDGGAVLIRIPALLNADGGLEQLGGSSVWFDDLGRTVRGWMYAEIPHFSQVLAANGSLPDSTDRGRVSVTASDMMAAYQVGDAFPFQVQVGPECGFYSCRIVAVTGNGALSFQRSPTASPPSGLAACLSAGPGALIVDVEYDNSGGSPPRTGRLQFWLRTQCVQPPPPPLASTPFITRLGVAGTNFPGSYCPPGSPLCGPASVKVEQVTATPELDVALTLPCGASQKGPCSPGVVYTAPLQLTFGATTVRVDRAEAIAGTGAAPALAVASPPLQPSFAGATPLSLNGASYPLSSVPSQVVDGTLQFTCQQAGRFPLRVTLTLSQVVGVTLAKPVTYEAHAGLVQCGSADGDALMLADNTRLVRSGATFNAQPTGVTANVIAAAPPVRDRFGAFAPSVVGYDGVTTFASDLGWPKLRLQSGLQNAVFTHDGTRYVQTGLVGSAAYGASDTLTVTGLWADGGTGVLPDGGLPQVVVSAPPQLPAPGALLGPLAGLATPVRVPDGTFDVLYVTVNATSPRGGQGGLFRTVRAADMSLDGGVREAPILDGVSRAALQAWGLTPSSVYVAAYREQPSGAFFTWPDGGTRVVPVQAGRMVQLTVSELNP